MGYLNAQPGDDDLVAAMGENGTDQVPGPSTFQGTGKALEQSLPGAIDSMQRTAEDFSSAAANWEDQHLPGWLDTALKYVPQNPAAGYNMERAAQAIDPEQAQEINAGRQELEKWIDDTSTEGSGARMVGGFTSGVAKFATGFVAGGPLGAAALMGGTASDETYRQAIANGMDDKTAMEAAGLAGALNATGGLVIGGFANTPTRYLGNVAINVGLGLVSRTAQHEVLEANGYDKIAAAQQIFDTKQMTADAILAIVGTGIAEGFDHFIVPPSRVDAARVVDTQGHAQESVPGIPIDPEVPNLHDEIFARGVADMQEGRNPTVTPEEAQKITQGVIADPAQGEMDAMTARTIAEHPAMQQATASQSALDAARTQVAANVPVFKPEDFGTLGETAHPHEAYMAQIAATRGPEVIDTDDGLATTVAQRVQNMRDELADADSDRRLMNTAVACFANMGGVG